MRTLSDDDLARGATLPPRRVAVTPATVAALATMEHGPVPHEAGRAVVHGDTDVVLNILTTMGLVERYVTDWVGPEALIRSINVRLGVPAYAGDTLTFNGTVAAREGGEVTVEVRGTVGIGDHATGTVRFQLSR
ncbi:acyl dehydratase [Sphaerisporangium krabiense]|nr:acyl dehydratase [Sphaerisporangium krabiense]